MKKLLLLPLLALLPVTGFADELNSGDTAWIMTSTALVLFMTLPGLALFYGGLVRAKNVLSVLMQCFAIACAMTIIWVLFGYSLAFGEGNAFIGDFSKVFFAGVSEDAMSGAIPESIFATFQLTFIIITPALIVGGFAERMKFSAMLVFSILWGIFVYLPVVHWVWASEGWLFKMGLLDFAGGTVVHITAGVAAMVAAIIMGPRKGFPKTAMLPHNMTLTIAGAGMLWVGWFGFNGGSALAADGNAAMAITVTHISAATGAFTWMCWEWIRFGKPSALGIVTGLIAGLGTITPASGAVGPGGALIIGMLAGTVCFFATNFVKRTLKIDDSLDVMPVHGVGGILGTLLVGVFASTELGLFSGQGFGDGISSIPEQMGVQAIGVGATFAYTAIVTTIILLVVRAVIGLRVDDEQEQQGLDINQHDERGYDL